MTTFASCALAPNADGPLLLDTSAAIALVTPAHTGYTRVRAAASGHRLGLSGHAVFETYSVLTRLPRADRPSAEQAARIIRHNFPESRMLSAERQESLLAYIADRRLVGGQVYDALVAAAAVEADLPLISRDQRAAQVYEMVGARFSLV